MLHLDAANVKSYPGTGTVWNDLSGNNYNGALVNGAIYNAANKGIMSFDGVNDYVNIAGNGLTLSNFSIDTVIRPLSNDGSFNGILSATLGTLNDYEYGINIDIGQSASLSFSSLNLEISTAYGGFVNRNAMTSSFPFNTWVHLSIAVDSVADTYKVYVNGTQEYSGIYLGTITNFDKIVIGQRYYGGGYQGASSFSGNIPLMKIYNRALSASEVRQNFEAVRGRYDI